MNSLRSYINKIEEGFKLGNDNWNSRKDRKTFIPKNDAELTEEIHNALKQNNYKYIDLNYIDISEYLDNNENLQFVFSEIKCDILDISNWNFDNLKDGSYIFYNSKIKEVIGLENIKTKRNNNLTSFSNCFKNSDIGNISKVGEWDMTSIKDVALMFYEAKNIDTIDFSKWDMRNCSRFTQMFSKSDCSNLDTISNWDMTSATLFNSMFSQCVELKKLDLSKWNPKHLINTGGMFWYCRKLTTTGDISNWDMSDVGLAARMFGECRDLNYIGEVGKKWKFKKTCQREFMFCNSPNIKKFRFKTI